MTRQRGLFDFDNTGAEEGMVRLFINIGKKRPRETGRYLRWLQANPVPGKLVDFIDMYDKLHIRGSAERIRKRSFRSHENAKTKGRSVNMEPANQK